MGGGIPGGAPGGHSVPPPALPGGGFPGLGAPPFGARPAGPSGRAPGAPAPNPFAPTPSPLQQGGAAPAARQSRPAGGAHAGAPAGARIDPFSAPAGAAIPQQKKVTLVIDDSAVKEDEIGRKSRTRSMVLVIIGVGLGLFAGYGVGNTIDKRHQYSMAVQDGKDIYAKVQDVSKTVDQAKALVKQVLDASSGGPGRKATVDFSSIEQLVAMKRPFSANEFHRRLYRAFGDGTVDDLFDYYNNINLAWDGFAALGAKTAGNVRREALTKSAAATDGLLNNEYGMVLSKSGDAFAGGLVFVTIPAGDAAPAKEKPEGKKGKKGKAAAEDEGIKVKVSSTQGGQEVERTLYAGQEIGESFEKYVFMVDKVRSRTILGESANVFGKFRADVNEINARMEKATEVQGRLLKSLGGIASLN
jgi:hypothetical protein